jgi:hypothetical protein
MQKIVVEGLTLYFDAEEQEAAGWVRQACERSVRLLREQWGLAAPKDCRVYIMTSWLDFAFRSAPWPWKVLLALTLPLWAFRIRKLWPLAGGWAQSYGRRRAVGVKPPRLLQLADRRMGERIFIEEGTLDEKVQRITCHELTHAFTSHLRLPPWLQEGLAMVMVDRCFERPTVRPETLALLDPSPGRQSTRGDQKLRIEDEGASITLYARGYWLTRYLEETRPGLLKELLARRYRQDELEGQIASAYGKRPEEFWGEVDGVLSSHFGAAA